MDARILYPMWFDLGEKYHPRLIHIFRVDISHNSLDMTGQVSSGTMKLTGRLAKYLPAKTGSATGDIAAFAGEFELDEIWQDDSGYWPSKDLHYYLPVKICYDRGGTGAMFGLILVRTERSSNQFERIGLWAVNWPLPRFMGLTKDEWNDVHCSSADRLVEIEIV